MTERIERRLLLIGAVATPLFFLWSVTNDAFSVPKIALLLSITATAAALRAWTAVWWSAPRERGILVPAACFAIPFFVAWSAGTHQGWALFGRYQRFQGLIPYLLVVAFGIMLGTSRISPQKIARGMVTSGALVGFYGVLQVTGMDPLKLVVDDLFHFGLTSTIGNPNFVGGFIAITLPATVSFWITRALPPWIAIPTVVASVLALFLTGSQGGWVASVAAVWLLIYPHVRRRFGRRIAAGISAAGLTILVAIVALVVVDENLGIQTLRYRGNWWRAAAAMGSERPLTGYGPNAFAYLGPTYRTPGEALELGFELADDPHSVPFALFANTGLIGLAGFIAIALWAARLRPTSADHVELIWIFRAAIAAYFVQSLVTIDEFPLRIALWTVLAGLLLAVRHRPDEAANRRATPLRVLAAVVASVAAVAFTAWSVLFVWHDHQVRTAGLTPTATPRRAVDAFQNALAFRDEVEYRELYGETLALIARNRKATDPYLSMMRDTFSYLEDLPDPRGFVIFAQSLHTLAPLDRSLAAQAADVYQLALARVPGDPDLLRDRALAEIHAGDLDRARSILIELLEAIEATPRAEPRPAAQGDLVMVDAALGNYDAVRRELPLLLSQELNCGGVVAEELLDPKRATDKDIFKIGVTCGEVYVEILEIYDT